MLENCVHERALGVHVEAPRPEERHAGTEHVRELDHLAGLDQLRGVHHGRGLLMIARTALVGCAPFRRTALAFRRNGPAWCLRVGGGGKRKRDRRTQCECFHLYPPKRGALETAPLRQIMLSPSGSVSSPARRAPRRCATGSCGGAPWPGVKATPGTKLAQFRASTHAPEVRYGEGRMVPEGTLPRASGLASQGVSTS